MNFARRAATPTATSSTASPSVSASSSAPTTVVVIVLAVLVLPVALRLVSDGLLGRTWLLLLRVPGKIGNGTRNRFRILVNVEALVNAGGDGLNFGAQVSLNVV